jgi:hypothetical protein
MAGVIRGNGMNRGEYGINQTSCDTTQGALKDKTTQTFA